MYKIILSFVGFFLLGRNYLGAILGFIIGSIIDNRVAHRSNTGGNNQAAYYRKSATQDQFITSLMVLSAAVMRADGKTVKAELDYIKQFFNQQFGNQFTTDHLKVLKHFLSGSPIPLAEICNDIKLRTQLQARILLLHYLFGIAKADNDVAEVELKVIQNIANLLAIPAADFESIKNMFYRDVDSDYKVLGLNSSATEEEIKKAYRQMAIQYHPDKVLHLGEAYQKRAKDKFQQLQDAYENIKKKRGIN